MDNYTTLMAKKKFRAEFASPVNIAIFKALVNGDGYIKVCQTFITHDRKIKVVFDTLVRYLHESVLSTYTLDLSMNGVRKKSSLWLKALEIWYNGITMWNDRDEYYLQQSTPNYDLSTRNNLLQWTVSMHCNEELRKAENRKRRTLRNIALFKDIISGISLIEVQTKYGVSKHMVTAIFANVRKSVERDTTLEKILKQVTPHNYAPIDGSLYSVYWIRSHATLWLKATNRYVASL